MSRPPPHEDGQNEGSEQQAGCDSRQPRPRPLIPSTPREHSSGNGRYVGRITKEGDAYLRTLLIHGARSALTAAQVRQRSGKPLTRIQRWAVQKAGELRHSNQASVALANKLARICWAVWKHERRYDGNYLPQAA